MVDEAAWVAQMRALNAARLASHATMTYKPTSTTRATGTTSNVNASSGGGLGGFDPVSTGIDYASEKKAAQDAALGKADKYTPSKEKLRHSEDMFRNGGYGGRQPQDGNGQLTEDEYAGLSDRQKSLVNAQTQLYEAVMADRADDAALSADARRSSLEAEDYKSAVDALFGAKGGSNTYAPRTVAVLTELGMNGKDDLDQWLNGSFFQSKEEILAMPTERPKDKAGAHQPSLVGRLADTGSNEGLAPLLERGASILASVQGRQDLPFAQGLQPETPDSKLDSLTPEQEQGLQVMMMGMALPQQPAELAGHYETLKSQMGLDDDTIGRFLARNLASQEAGLTSMGEGYISPQEFRARWKVTGYGSDSQ